MLRITKTEAIAMRGKCGAGSVKKSYSKHPTYYLVESYKNLKKLEQYRKEHTIFDSRLKSHLSVEWLKKSLVLAQ